MWYYIDSKNCILGSNPNDMSKNSGWIENGKVIDSLTDENGIALYKLVGGEVVKREQEEMIVSDPVKTEPERSLEDRVAEIETLVKGTPTYGELLEAVNILLGE